MDILLTKHFLIRDVEKGHDLHASFYTLFKEREINN
jgi:hypothetical protein